MNDGFSIGPLRIYWYSLTLLAAVWLGYWVLVRQAKKKRLSVNLMTDATLTVLISSVVGARLGFVLQNLEYFSQQPNEILRLTSGGLSIHGALVAGTLALWLFARRRSIAFLQLTDVFAPPLLVGQIVGRLGNYFNQELYGYPTTVPWSISIDPTHRLPGYFEISRYHPVFLYEMILHGIGLVILWRWQNKAPIHVGQLTGGYLVVTGVSRFITEIFRISDRLFGGISLAQLVSLGLVLVGAWLVIERGGRPKS